MKRRFAMAHSFVSSLYHVVFSTKERQRTIAPALQQRPWPYIGGVAREHKMKALDVGGVEDHVHVLLSLPSTLSIAKAVQLIKGASSTWIHETFPEYRNVYWQEGYGAFSIGISQVEHTIRYIRNQAEHHRRITFEDESRAFLERHGIEYDERYIWG
jgi:REP element-mobilizing transposase RayT